MKRRESMQGLIGGGILGLIALLTGFIQTELQLYIARFLQPPASSKDKAA
jgi:hypothetical protein